MVMKGWQPVNAPAMNIYCKYWVSNVRERLLVDPIVTESPEIASQGAVWIVNMSYHKISQSLESVKLCINAHDTLKSGRRFSRSAVKAFVKLQRDLKFLNINFAPSRLCEKWR